MCNDDQNSITGGLVRHSRNFVLLLRGEVLSVSLRTESGLNFLPLFENVTAYFRVNSGVTHFSKEIRVFCCVVLCINHMSLTNISRGLSNWA